MLKISKAALASALFFSLSAMTAAAAQATFKQGAFIEGSVGLNYGMVSDFTFTNPVGVSNPLRSSAASGDEIIMDDTDESDTSLGADFALGYRYNRNMFVRASYTYYDQLEFEGFATFGGIAYQQLMQVSAHAMMLEWGYDHPLGNKFYVEGAVGAGLAFVSTDARQGLNVPGTYNIFPGDTRTNPAASLTLGLGYQFTDSLDLLVSGEYAYLGRASSGRTGDAEFAASTGVNLSEELSGDLRVWRTMVGVRYSF